MTAAEVQPVMHALRAAGINIVVLHNHMIGEERCAAKRKHDKFTVRSRCVISA